MKKNQKVLVVIFCLFAVMLYLFSSVRIVAFDGKMYESFFSANRIYSALPDANERAINLLGYLKTGQELNTTFFNEREITHMKDVKALFAFSYIMLVIAMLCCLAIVAYAFIIRNPKFLGSCLLFGGISALGFAVLMFLLSLNFALFFTYFHKLLFSNNFWLMNPLTDKIIVLLPEAFFRLAAMRMFLTFGMLSIGMLAAGILVRWMAKRM